MTFTIKRFLSGALVSVAIAAVAWAQSAPPLPPPPPLGAEGEANVVFSYVGSGDGPGHKVVKGAPFSAQSSSETTQVLSDGNRIYHKTSGQIFRDSEGRTRRENTLLSMGPWTPAGEAHQIISIHDVVAGVHYILEPDQKIARVMKHGSGEPFNVKTGGFRALAGGGQAPPLPQVEPLGKETIEGIEAEGTRSTITIPAGQIGNDRPIVIVSERWYSPELQTVVMSKHSDPRMGETVFHLTNISRTEPAASLFAVPSDYTVKEGHEFGKVKMLMRQSPPPPDGPPPDEED